MLGNLVGPGYSVQVPPGFDVMPINPFGGYFLVPPGSHRPPLSPGLVMLEPVPPQWFTTLLQNIYNFEDPYVAMMNAQSLQLGQVIAMSPARQTMLPGGITHIREFDAYSFNGQPMRVMVLVIVGSQSAVKVVIILNLYVWANFINPCLQLVNGISLLGTQPIPAHLQAVVDHNHKDQIEYRIVTNDNRQFPLTALPTSVGTQVIVNIERIITTGSINGTGISVGDHAVSTVSKGV